MLMLIQNELAAVGLQCNQMKNGAPVVEGDQQLVALILAAHGKIAGDPEIATLKDYLRGDSRWDAYVACRRAEIQEQRNDKFKTLTDTMLLDLLESAVTSDTGDGYLLSVSKAKFDAWKAAKNKIRNDLPYEVA